jgi:hypothetical protein
VGLAFAWYVSGYKGRNNISAKAIDVQQAAYLADVFRREGVTKFTVHNDAER